jgi:uncharacterized membrane protein SirB2
MVSGYFTNLIFSIITVALYIVMPTLLMNKFTRQETIQFLFFAGVLAFLIPLVFLQL